MLVAKEVQILFKYSDFLDVFLEEKTLVLLKATNLNKYAIKLQYGQQPSYKLIYSLGLVKLKMLKTYIESNLVNSFIWALKSLADALIFFVGKLDGSFCLYVDY